MKKVRSYGLGVRWYKESKTYFVHLSEEPRWVWALGNVVAWTDFRFLWKIHLPKFIRIDVGESQKVSLREWWGSVGSLYFYYVVSPVLSWLEDEKRTTSWTVDITREQAIDIFKDDPYVLDLMD